MAEGIAPEPPAPSPEMVTASRRHLTARFARGVDGLLWDLDKRFMPDAEAVRAVISAAAAGQDADGLDVAAALVVTQAMRLELDLLEAEVLEAGQRGGLSAEAMAAVLEMPGADAVAIRQRMLAAKRALPRAAPEPGMAVARGEGNREAAARAARRAGQAAERAAQAGRRRTQLRRADTGGEAGSDRGASGENAEQAAAYASEARVNARDAAERVALGLLRAAEALDQCAVRSREWEKETVAQGRRELLRQRTGEYAEAARTYRNMAARYRDIGRQIP